MPTDTQRGTEIAGHSTDVGARRTVHLDVNINELAVATRCQHLEPIDAHRPGGKLDSAALPDQPVSAATADLDRADRRGHLLDVAAEPGYRGGDYGVGQVLGWNRLQHFT